MKHELTHALSQLSTVFEDAPNVGQFDIKDGHGNVVVSSGKHVIPGGLIGIGIGMYADSIKRRLPMISMKFGFIFGALAGVVYEGVDTCGEPLPNAEGVLETCRQGFLDGATPAHAVVDSASDIFITSSFSSLSALAVGALAYSVRKKYIKQKFYHRSEEESTKDMAMDIFPDSGDKAIIVDVDK